VRWTELVDQEMLAGEVLKKNSYLTTAKEAEFNFLRGTNSILGSD